MITHMEGACFSEVSHTIAFAQMCCAVCQRSLNSVYTAARAVDVYIHVRIGGCGHMSILYVISYDMVSVISNPIPNPNPIILLISVTLSLRVCRFLRLWLQYYLYG